MFDEEVKPSTSQNTAIDKQEADLSDEIILVDEVSSTTSKESSDKKANMQQMSLKQIKKIKEILKITKSNGESAIGGEASELPILPGLFVRNFGDVSIPLCSQQAEDLIKVCKQASFGLKSENMANFRNLYELEPSQIQIKNSSWNQSLNKLVEKVATDLGCVGKVIAKLHKMLLYKQGGHFNKQRNIMKEKDVFGTLIIQLPSNYTGGEVIVYDNNDSPFKYDFGQSNGKSGYSVHYAAHYSDLEHEILEVTSGYRSVLVYDLCWESGNGVCLNDGSSVASMASALSILNESFVPLALFLDEKYTDKSFQSKGIKALKGVDSQRFNLLKKASNKLSDDKKSSCFYIFKASLKVEDIDFRRVYYTNTSLDDEAKKKTEKEDELSDNSDSDESDESECDDYESSYDSCYSSDNKKLNIDALFDSGGKLYKDVKLEFDFFKEIINSKNDVKKTCDIEKIKWWDKHVQLYDETNRYDSNYDSYVTTIYQKYFLMILPKAKELKLAFDLSVSHGVDKALEKFSNSSDPESVKYLLNSINKQAKAKSKKGYGDPKSQLKQLITSDQTNKILDILIALNDVSLVQLFTSCFDKYIEIDFEVLTRLLEHFRFEALKPIFKEFVFPNNKKNISVNCRLIEVSIVALISI